MLRYMYHIITAAILLNSLLVVSVQANNSPSPELLAERKNVFDKCKNNHTESAYRDCACYADAYLAERQKQPEQRYISSAKKAVSGMCLNLESIYSYELNQCLRDSVSDTMKEERKKQNSKICHCKTDFLKENIENEKVINHRTIDKLRRAFIAPCTCLVKSPNRNCTHPKLMRGYSVPEVYSE